MMAPPVAFGVEDAGALQALLSAPERPKDTMPYFETAGFLFAVCCNPDLVKPAEWLPVVLGEDGGFFADLEEANRVLQLVMGLYNHVNAGVLARRPELPPLCEVRLGALDNLDADAPLSRWSRGFAEGHDWLALSWPDDLPDELDEGLGATLVVLTFHSSPRLAEAYRNETKGTPMAMEAMAAKMQEMLLPTMAAYANLGRGLYEGLLRPQARSARRSGGRRGRSRSKRGA
jgi:yecA family protein